ncbi:hypothetical protein ACWEQ2_10170 [Streptomyces sp. NPDC004096]|uniref:hypothetical protein n=1 Tax=unclassified Streptomyces TaxID=2593676 RepID=UPI0033BCF3A2
MPVPRDGTGELRRAADLAAEAGGRAAAPNGARRRPRAADALLDTVPSPVHPTAELPAPLSVLTRRTV